MPKKFIRCVSGDEEVFGELRDDIIIYNGFEASLDEVEVLAPVNPSKIICVGLNYKSHIREMNKSIPSSPVFFYKPPSSVIGESDEIVLPDKPQRVDYEAEMAVVIKEECRNVSREEAENYILGYTCLNDVTARDIQDKENQWVISKGYDTFCPIGPCISTEIPRDAKVTSYKNGVKKQSSDISELIFDENELVSRLSKAMTLEKGDVVSTGTPSGVGEVEKGDEIKIGVEGVGELTNIVD